MPFCITFVKQNGLVDGLVADCPLRDARPPRLSGLVPVFCSAVTGS